MNINELEDDIKYFAFSNIDGFFSVKTGKEWKEIYPIKKKTKSKNVVQNDVQFFEAMENENPMNDDPHGDESDFMQACRSFPDYIPSNLKETTEENTARVINRINELKRLSESEVVDKNLAVTIDPPPIENKPSIGVELNIEPEIQITIDPEI